MQQRLPGLGAHAVEMKLVDVAPRGCRPRAEPARRPRETSILSIVGGMVLTTRLHSSTDRYTYRPLSRTIRFAAERGRPGWNENSKPSTGMNLVDLEGDLAVPTQALEGVRFAAA